MFDERLKGEDIVQFSSQSRKVAGIMSAVAIA